MLVAGDNKKAAEANATRRIGRHASYAISGGDYRASIVSSGPIEFSLNMVKVRKKKPALTDIQVNILIKLLNGNQFWFNPGNYRWECGSTMVEQRTIVSMLQKDVIKCVPINAKEQAMQVALGTMNPDAIQLMINPEAELIQKSKKLKDLLK